MDQESLMQLCPVDRLPRELTQTRDIQNLSAPSNRPGLTREQDSLAYCIYTSGSTGRPKGALITHRNLVRLFVNDRFQFQFTPDDVWSMCHSYCFDFSVSPISPRTNVCTISGIMSGYGGCYDKGCTG